MIISVVWNNFISDHQGDGFWFKKKLKRQEVSSWAGLLIPDSSHEWYYHIGIPYLDSSLQSELLFKEKEKKRKENYYVYGTDSGNFLEK